MIAALSFNAPELAEELVKQVPEVKLIEIESHELEQAWFYLPKNEFWVRNWQRVINLICEETFAIDNRSPEYPYLWMLNDDITGASMEMYHELVKCAKELNSFMITPSFNSPHQVFHNKQTGIREVNWVDMCCPLINLEMFNNLGGFDLDFKGYGADIDLSYRAREKGLKMYVHDIFEINHIGGYTVYKNNTWEQSNVDEMNRVLLAKYGKTWNQLI